jgi:hypothetical protein
MRIKKVLNKKKNTNKIFLVLLLNIKVQCFELFFSIKINFFIKISLVYLCKCNKIMIKIYLKVFLKKI